MRIQPYLCFDGRCEEAIAFYRRALGAEVIALMRFADVPADTDSGGEGCAGGGPMPPGDTVMHGELRIGETTLLVSDGFAQGQAVFRGISLALSVRDDAQARESFDALAEEGRVETPLVPTFFSTRFGIVEDRFGVSWMVVGPEPAAAR
ncbi:VOC family protein [Luteimonas abyssi]|uniref:VOC family protein n=1 Tax=Luteimonas abyssi TaxID=1247514 RepID=UPI000737B336|nr:VOC family protein [Luteimonas abyssi]